MELYTDTYFMQEALKEACKAIDSNEVPVGAIVVAQNKIIAKAYNQVEQLADTTAHAEMLAITAASHYIGSKYLTDCTLYVTLEPCIMCGGALRWAQLGKLVFGAHDVQRGYSLVKHALLHPRTEVIAGIKRCESKALLDDFFKRMRN